MNPAVFHRLVRLCRVPPEQIESFLVEVKYPGLRWRLIARNEAAAPTLPGLVGKITSVATEYGAMHKKRGPYRVCIFCRNNQGYLGRFRIRFFIPVDDGEDLPWYRDRANLGRPAQVLGVPSRKPILDGYLQDLTGGGDVYVVSLDGRSCETTWKNVVLSDLSAPDSTTSSPARE